MIQKGTSRLISNFASPAMGAICLTVAAIRQDAFDSLAITVIAYLVAAITAFVTWYAGVAIAATGPIGKITGIGEENPRQYWLFIVVAIATIVAAGAFFSVIEIFRLFFELTARHSGTGCGPQLSNSSLPTLFWVAVPEPITKTQNLFIQEGA